MVLICEVSQSQLELANGLQDIQIYFKHELYLPK